MQQLDLVSSSNQFIFGPKFPHQACTFKCGDVGFLSHPPKPPRSPLPPPPPARVSSLISVWCAFVSSGQCLWICRNFKNWAYVPRSHPYCALNRSAEFSIRWELLHDWATGLKVCALKTWLETDLAKCTHDLTCWKELFKKF